MTDKQLFSNCTYILEIFCFMQISLHQHFYNFCHTQSPSLLMEMILLNPPLTNKELMRNMKNCKEAKDVYWQMASLKDREAKAVSW